MIRRYLSLFALCLLVLAAQAQGAKLRKALKLKRFHIPTANYSGITHVEGDTYAVVDDKSKTDGFFLLSLKIDRHNGKILSASRSGLKGPALPQKDAAWADCEDIVFVPQSQTLFIAQEHKGDVVEYKLDGQPTGRALKIPDFLKKSNQAPDAGFESLAYDQGSATFFLTTENHLKADPLVNGCQLLRILSFSNNLEPQHQWQYLMEAPELRNDVKYYTHGVPALTALDDHRLLVMERELSIPSSYLGGKCRIKIFLVELNSPSNAPLKKQFVTSFTTHISIRELNYANYEGMCLGPRLEDGRQTLLLINDSQASAGNRLCRLKDYVRIVILP